MSVAKKVFGKDGPDAGQKVLLRRRGPDLWRKGFVAWAGTAQVRWKALAMMQLHVHCNWSLQMIGLAFGQHRGRVSRLVRDAARRIAEFDKDATPGDSPDVAEFQKGTYYFLDAADRKRLLAVCETMQLAPAAALRRCLHESETFTGRATDGATEADVSPQSLS